MKRQFLRGSDIEASLVRMQRGIERADLPRALTSRLRALPNVVEPNDPEFLDMVSDSRTDTDRPAVRGPALATSYLLSFAGASFDVAIDVVRSAEHRAAEVRGLIIGTDGVKAEHHVLIGNRRCAADQHGQFRIEGVGDGPHVLRIAEPEGTTVAALALTID